MAYTMIASWGSSGSGKTTLALALAAQLAKRKKDVLIMSTDIKTPALPVYLPQLQTDARNSLGALLSTSVRFDESALKDKIHKHPKSDYMHFMGLASGEISTISYKAPERKTIINLMQVLQDSPFRYVIFDCDTNPVYDSLTLFGLENSDFVIRTVTPDIKGYEFQKAQLSWLGNSDLFHVKEHIRVINPVYDTSPIAVAETLFEGCNYKLQLQIAMVASSNGAFYCGRVTNPF